MGLRNPPVTQTWIAFKFLPGPTKPPWNLATVLDFLKRYESELPHREVITETEFRIQDVSGSLVPQIVSRQDTLDKARARDADSKHWLQLADDQMVDNRTRGGSYIGYDALRDDALAKLVDYVEVFQPASLLAVELHYVDLIEIPIPDGGNLDLQEYFELRTEMPELFGATRYFSTRVSVQLPDNAGTLDVRFQSEVPDRETKRYRFRLDWDVVCSTVSSFDTATVKSCLDRAHISLLDYFRASVTDKTWALFQPFDEN